MHWEPHEFDLPKLPKGMQWTLCINTDDADNNGICPPESLEAGQEPQEELRQYMVPPRSILVFRGFKPISGPASEKDGKKSWESGKIGKTAECQKRTGKGSGDCGCGSARTVRTELKEDKAS